MFSAGLLLLYGQEEDSLDLSHLLEMQPLSLLSQKAEELDLELEGVALASEREGLEEADWVHMLVQYEDKRSLEQWLVGIHVQALKEEERPTVVEPMVLHASTGDVLEFTRSPASVAMRIVGPFQTKKGKESGRKARDFWTGAIVNEDFLKLGLDRASETKMRLKKMLFQDGSMGISFRGEPFTEEELQATREKLAGRTIEADDLQALVGAAPALTEFLGIAMRTPSLGESVLEMLDISKLGVLLKRQLPEISISFEGDCTVLDPSDWGFPAGFQIYSLPLVVMVDDRDAVECRLVVCKPLAPLTACAGIIGLQAQSTGKGREKLFLRLMSGMPAERD